MIVLDASVLIAHLDGSDAHHAEAKRLLGATGGEPLGASVITLAETLVSPARTGRLDDAKTALERLGIDELDLGHDAPTRLAQLRADARLKMPDCCVLLAAQEHQAAVASFDSSLLAAARDLTLATTE